MNLGVFEDEGYVDLLPLVYFRACFELRCGRDRLIDKLERHVARPLGRFWTRPELNDVVAARMSPSTALPADDFALFNARAFVTADVSPPATGEAWIDRGELVAAGVSAQAAARLEHADFADAERRGAWLRGHRVTQPPPGVRLLRHPWELAPLNAAELTRQLGGAPARRDGRVHPGAHLVNEAAIAIGRDAVVKPGAVLDAEPGPIVVDDGAVVSPCAVVTGPCYVGPGALIQPGASIRGGTTIGPRCKVGGEVEASILHGFTNKQHDGFLGHSYVGQWVNLGADTVTSDLKNTYGTIRVAINGRPVESGQRFVGAIIGDHVKTGIGTMLPTGCVLGAVCNVFTSGRVPGFVPSYTWLSDTGLADYRVEKAVEVARIVMARRDVRLSDAEARLIAETAQRARALERGADAAC